MSSDELSRWETLTDRLLKDALTDGRFSNLAGEGRPLNLEDESHIPPELRLAHKILKDNDLAPDWIIVGKSIEQRRETLLAQLARAYRGYLGALGDAGRDPVQGVVRQQQAESVWQQALAGFQKTADRLNSELLSYNLKIPPGITQKIPLNVAQEVRRLQAQG